MKFEDKVSDRVYRSILEPIRANPTYDERWKGDDRGLVTCWEVGRKKRAVEPNLVKKVEDSELPSLEWKGGFDSALIEKKGLAH